MKLREMTSAEAYAKKLRGELVDLEAEKIQVATRKMTYAEKLCSEMADELTLGEVLAEEREVIGRKGAFGTMDIG